MAGNRPFSSASSYWRLRSPLDLIPRRIPSFQNGIETQLVGLGRLHKRGQGYRDSRHDPFERLAQVGKYVPDEPVRARPVEQLVRPPARFVQLDLPRRTFSLSTTITFRWGYDRTDHLILGEIRSADKVHLFVTQKVVDLVV